MNILCATDDNYVPYCGIMLTSLFENNKQENIKVYVLTGGLNNNNKKLFDKLADKYSQSIDIITVDNNTFKECPIRQEIDHVSIAAYYRLAVSELLPTDLNRILYLDCDIIVNTSLTELYTTELTGYACGVVADEAFMVDAPYERLSIPKTIESPYFNSGMLLINLDYWKEHDVMRECMDYISKNASRLAFHDQDTLNAILRGKVKYLDIKYNLQRELILKEVFNELPSDIQLSVKSASSSPIIIHYTGAGKPWIIGCRHPLKSKWIDTMNISLWNNISLIKPKRNIKSLMLDIRNEIIWTIGLKKRPQNYII